MEQDFTYEASEQMLVIHLPREVDHHNCTALKNETDLDFGRKLCDQNDF